MTLIILVFLGGALTIVSPCILPVLPFVFARAERPFFRNGLPMLVGMALTFALVATLAAVGGAWAVHLNQYGRVVALAVLSALALTLLSDRLADRLAHPFVTLGNRLTATPQPTGSHVGSDAGSEAGGVARSVLLGVATGLLWAPCAGPILGLVLTGAAIAGPSTRTSLLLLAYAVGAAASLAVALLAGRRLFAAMKRSLGAGVWIRRVLGVAVLVGVVAIASGADTGVLTRLSLARTDHLEQSLVSRIQSNAGSVAVVAGFAVPQPISGVLPDEGALPSLAGATAWFNSPVLTTQQLQGKVVLVDFWTYSCINCLRSLPYVKSWYQKYKDHGLTVIGVHSPEFAFERDTDNVHHALDQLEVQYPVALDNNFAIWRTFNNQYWPAHYFIDAQGRIRGHHFGEGDYEHSEQLIRELLLRAGAKDLPPAGMDATQLRGVQATSDQRHEQSPETYVGYARAEHFGSPAGFTQDRPALYLVPASLPLNQWALAGTWTVQGKQARLDRAGGHVVFHFFARDLHLVLGPGVGARPIRFRVRLDGAAPGTDHGDDTDTQGNGVVREQRLYQLIRQRGDLHEREFSIEFLDDAVSVYAFTFG